MEGKGNRGFCLVGTMLLPPRKGAFRDGSNAGTLFSFGRDGVILSKFGVAGIMFPMSP